MFRTPKHPYTRALLDSVLLPVPGAGIPDVGLGDTYPDPAAIPPGCRFHPRCRLSDAACATTVPTPRQVAGRMVECMLAAE